MNLVVTSEEMIRLEELAGSGHEETWMREAGKGVALSLLEEFEGKKRCLLLVGKGNKGGDALVAGKELLERGLLVHAFSLYPPPVCSSLQQKMREEFCEKGGKFVPVFDPSLYDFIVDGLLGTGFSNKITSPLKELIEDANLSSLPIAAIDLPSGLNGTTGEGDPHTIRAACTIALGCAKKGCFVRDGWNCTGKILVKDFGWNLAEQARPFALLATEALLPPLVRNRHKYEAGLVVGFGGSCLFSGAPKLSSFGAFRMGAGLVHLFYPKEATPFMGNSFYELIHSPFDPDLWEKELRRAKALFVGPGLGSDFDIAAWSSSHLNKTSLPCVLDARAMFAPVWPEKTILTPHRQEALNLFDMDVSSSMEDLLTNAQLSSDRTQAVFVLKGAPSFVIRPKKLPVILPYGDPGMATAGTGDVLTGMIAALLAQGLSLEEAAISGGILHGLAGQCAAKKLTSYSMMATDLIANIPDAIQALGN